LSEFFFVFLLPIGFFAASTGAAAALQTAANDPRIRTVVCRGGRPDLAAESLAEVKVSVLLLVGGSDPEVLSLNQWARQRLPMGKLTVGFKIPIFVTKGILTKPVFRLYKI
jgi:dienelactone hydrolase